MKLKQISIFIENSPGRLYEATHALGQNGINLRALSLVDTAGYGVLAIVGFFTHELGMRKGP